MERGQAVHGAMRGIILYTYRLCKQNIEITWLDDLKYIYRTFLHSNMGATNQLMNILYDIFTTSFLKHIHPKSNRINNVIPFPDAPGSLCLVIWKLR